MNATERLFSRDELVALFTRRQQRLAALEAMLATAPRSDDTRWQRKLVAHARFSTWLALEGLGVERPA